MPYTPLTEDQFNTARSKGFTTDQIIGFEKQRKAEQSPTPSVASEGWEYLENHPVKALMQPISQTFTGKTPMQMAEEASPITEPPIRKSGRTVIMPTQAEMDPQLSRRQAQIELALPAEAVSAPINLIGGRLLKPISQIPEAIGKFSGFEAGRLINSLIKPAQKAFNFGKNPGYQVVKERIVANNMEDLGTKIKGKLEEASQNLKQRIGTSNNIPDDYSDMLKPIDQAITDAKRLPKTNDALITRLENARSDLLQKRDLTKLTPQEAVQLKRDIGDVTKWTKEGTDDATANKTLKQAYHSVKIKLEKNIPGIKADNERLANLIDADVASTKRTNMLQKADLAGGLFEKGSLLTALYGALTGNVHEAIGGIGVFGIKKLMDSPAAKTRIAQWLNNLSKSDLANVFNKYPQLKPLVRTEETQESPTKPQLLRLPSPSTVSKPAYVKAREEAEIPKLGAKRAFGAEKPFYTKGSNKLENIRRKSARYNKGEVIDVGAE